MTPHTRFALRTRSAALLMAAALIGHAGQALASGIPVVDGASIADRMIKHIETMAKYAEQIAVMQDQLKSQERQFEAITGSRSLGDILNNPEIRNALPSDVRDVLRASESNLGALANTVERIKQEEMLTGDHAQDSRRLAQRTQDLAYRSKALLEQTQTAMTARMRQVDQLQRQINHTTDPKAIADLQARLMVEQANIQVDQARADLLSRQLHAEQTLVTQQADKLAASSFSIDAIRAPLPGRR